MTTKIYIPGAIAVIAFIMMVLAPAADSPAAGFKTAVFYVA